MICKKGIKKLDTTKVVVRTAISFVAKITNKGKVKQLQQIANLLGVLRKDLWQKYGVSQGWNCDIFQATKEYCKLKHYSSYNLSYKNYERTTYQVLKDISLYHAAIKSYVVKDIYKTYTDKQVRKDLCLILKQGTWEDVIKNAWLHSQVRKYLNHGKTNVVNQIILCKEQYKLTLDTRGNSWLIISTNEARKRIALPLSGKSQLEGELKLIIKNSCVEIHYPEKVEMIKHSKQQDLRIGVDRGYTEVFATSSDEFLGNGLGKIISEYTDNTSTKGKSRNRLGAILRKLQTRKDDKSLAKVNRISKFNLGKQKLKKIKLTYQRKLKAIIIPAVNTLVNNYSEIAYEDLTTPIVSNKPMRKKTKNCLSTWCKGIVASYLEHKAKLGCSKLYPVNCAYTSQWCVYSQTLGLRSGDVIYSINGRKYQADKLAGKAILERSFDKQISLYLKSTEVKKILWSRTQEYIKRCGMDCTMTLESWKGEISSRHNLQLNQ
jgi:hypothetical protein